MQTEDSGLIRLYVTTHLFLDGTILSTSRLQYLADEPDEVVQKKMQVQHKTMLKRLRDGDFDNPEDVAARAHAHRAERSGELGVPRELSAEAAPPTLRQAAPPLHSEAPRAPVAPSGPILAPVAPPPMLPRSATPTGTLAERLRRTGGGVGGPPPPPIPGARPTPSTPPAAPKRVAEPQAVLEFEADLPDDDDLEPAVTIEVADPGPEPTLSFGASKVPLPTPQPQAQPQAQPQPLPVTAAGGGPTASLSQTGSPRWSSPAAPAVAPVTPPPPASIVAAPMPLAPGRTGLASTLRAKPTAEGVVLQRTLVPTPSLRPGGDSVRTTSPRARPTAPAPLAVAQSLHPMDDERSLDPLVLAYLAREIRPRDA